MTGRQSQKQKCWGWRIKDKSGAGHGQCVLVVIYSRGFIFSGIYYDFEMEVLAVYRANRRGTYQALATSDGCRSRLR